MPAYHFINLVCWEQFDEYLTDGDTVFLDSRSICSAAKTVGKSATRFSGVEMASRFKSLKPSRDIYRLTARPSDAALNYTFNLDMIEDIQSFAVEGSLLEFLLNIPIGKDLLIGISSPKQNILAKKILLVRPDLHVYCLGAALDRYEEEIKASLALPLFNEQEWLKFLISQPLRTINKIYFTLRELIRIMFLSDVKSRFLYFLEQASLDDKH